MGERPKTSAETDNATTATESEARLVMGGPSGIPPMLLPSTGGGSGFFESPIEGELGAGGGYRRPPAVVSSSAEVLIFASTALRNAWRARDNPDMTVPIGMPRTWANSR